MVEKIPFFVFAKIDYEDLECLKLLIADIGTLRSFIYFATKRAFIRVFQSLGKKFSTVIVGFFLLPLYHSWEKAKDLWEASPIGVLNKVFTWSSPLVRPVNVGPVSCKAMADLVPVAEKKTSSCAAKPIKFQSSFGRES